MEKDKDALALELQQLDIALKTQQLENHAKRSAADIQQTIVETALKQLELETKSRTGNADRNDSWHNGEFTLYDSVSESKVKAIVASINLCHRTYPGKPMTLILCSPGGDVMHGLALYDLLQTMRNQGHHLTVRCFGMAASMGSILLQAGDVREIGGYAHVLIHEVSTFTWGKLFELKDEVEFCKNLWDKLAKILAGRSNMTADEIQKKADRKEWWMDAAEALEHGFVDKVI